MEELRRAKREISVMALLISPDDGEGEGDDSMYDEEDEWEQEFDYMEEEDQYELPLKPGHYMIVIKHP